MWPLGEDCGCRVEEKDLGLSGGELLHSRRLPSHPWEWTFGDFDRHVRDRLRALRAIGVGPRPDGLQREGWGLDLGCGAGVSALALARLGLQVVAVDRCRSTLAELGTHDSTRSVEVVPADLLDFLAGNSRRFDVIACLDGALPRLASHAGVERLLRHLPRTLLPGGRALIAMRDHSRLREGRHFLRLHQDGQRSLTRVLDVGPRRVEIRDWIHERGRAGCQVSLRHSTDLRIDPESIGRVLRGVGLEARRWDGRPGDAGWIATQPG